MLTDPNSTIKGKNNIRNVIMIALNFKSKVYFFFHEQTNDKQNTDQSQNN